MLPLEPCENPSLVPWVPDEPQLSPSHRPVCLNTASSADTRVPRRRLAPHHHTHTSRGEDLGSPSRGRAEPGRGGGRRKARGLAPSMSRDLQPRPVRRLLMSGGVKN